MTPTTVDQSPALKFQASTYPAAYHGKVPKKVVMAETVHGDLPFIRPQLVAFKNCKYEVWVNSYGAVAAILPDYGGKALGLRPGEFEVIEWHEQPPSNA